MFALDSDVVCRFNERTIGSADTVLDRGKLEAALARPYASFGGRSMFPRHVDKAAVLCAGVCAAHAFIDGNKRTALECMVVFLESAGLVLETVDQEFLGQMVVDVATHQVTVEELAAWLLAHTAVKPR